MIQKLWKWILNLGVSQQYTEENELIQIYNMMSTLSIIGAILNLIAVQWMNFSVAYFWVNLLILLIYLFVLALNSLNQIYLARYFVAIASPLWICGVSCLIGGNFSQGTGILASMAITFVAFQKKPRHKWALLAFNATIFLVASAFVNTQGPILGVIDFPFDEISVFIGGFGWAIAVLYKFDKDKTALLGSLKHKNQELEDTTEELERFTYIASHDLKSPLRNIISFVGLIERNIKRGNYESIAENLNFVKTGAEQMHFLVNDILELSKLKNKEAAERTLIDLNIVLEKAVRNLKVDLEEKGAALDCMKLPQYYGNELEMVLLFQNFIQNGIKYNESAKPTISVSATEGNGEVRLSFKDNGIGIEEAYHEQIFQFFKRLHNSTKYQGTGLGLGLCKRIVNSYEGRIEIDSEVGKGSTFIIILPVSKSYQRKKARVQAI